MLAEHGEGEVIVLYLKQHFRPVSLVLIASAASPHRLQVCTREVQKPLQGLQLAVKLG